MKSVKRLIVALLGIALGFSGVWAAGCPEGKFEVIMTTPSGNQKTMCVSNNAVQGIENAAEHSESILIPIDCDCWTRDDINALSANPSFYCEWKVPTEPSLCLPPGCPQKTLYCYSDSQKFADLIMKTYDGSSSQCTNVKINVTATVKPDIEEACMSLLEGYIKN